MPRGLAIHHEGIYPKRYCQGKICYDKRGAQTVKNKREDEDGIKLRIYPCPACGQWHLTHKL